MTTARQGGANEFIVSDAVLGANLVHIGEDSDDRRFEYGKIFLPNFREVWAPGVNVPGNFASDRTTSVTVRGPGGNLILDSNNEDLVRYVVNPATLERVYFFQPQGAISFANQAQEDAGRAGNLLDATPVDSNVRVDGDYIITFTMKFQNVTVPFTMTLSMGDIVRPEIGFHNITIEGMSIEELGKKAMENRIIKTRRSCK